MTTALVESGAFSAAIARSRAALRTHGKSFALAGRFLPSGLLDEAAVVYAFCRRADDSVDLAPIAEQPRRAAALRREVRAVYAGEVQADPVLRAFQRVVAERGIPAQYPEELVAGIEMDARGTRYADVEALLGYCFRVAGTVGLMMCHVFGVRDARALRHAAHLGMAMQLTNVCRDIAQDHARGRCYLPAALLDAAGVVLVPGEGGSPSPAMRAPLAGVTTALLEHADRLYASGDRGIPYLPFRAALTVRTARLVYSDIGRVIRRRSADPLAARAVVGAGRKLLLALRAVADTLSLAARPFEPARLTVPLGYSDVR
jgi:phytoene synthase